MKKNTPAVTVEVDFTTAEGFRAGLKSVAQAYNRAQKAGETQADRLAVLTFEGVAAGRISDKPSKAQKEEGVLSFSDYAANFRNRMGKPHSRKDALLWINLGGALAIGMDPDSEDYKSLKSGKRALHGDLKELSKGTDGNLTPEKVGNIVASPSKKKASPRKNKKNSTTGAAIVKAVTDSLAAADKRYEKLTVKQRETIAAAIETYTASVAAQEEADAEPEKASA